VAELDREGITAEVLFQDFGTPFVMSSPTRAAALGTVRFWPPQPAAAPERRAHWWR
jgi:hypothetical protein